MKTYEEIMEILEAYDLTKSYRAAAELAGCDHHTVRRYVKLRGQGSDPTRRVERPKMIEPFLPKIEELVERSQAKVGADVVHERITALGFAGTDRTTRRAVAIAKASWRAGNRRVFRPWTPEPGLWLQWDWGEGPRIKGRRTWLWCAWLAWSRFRVVIPVLDKTLPTIVACLDTTLRRIGGAPTYALTDNEKTVTIDHVARIAVRNPAIVEVGHHYGMAIRTCLPADPQSKGGSEATVRIAKRDLVPTEVNLRAVYGTFGHLEAACRAFTEEINAKVHRETKRIPGDMLAEERRHLHVLPKAPFAVAFGETRRVCWDATISVEGVRYSVPHQLIDTRVWARFHGDELVVTAVGEDGPAEVARHERSTPGNPKIADEHYPPRKDHHGVRTPKASTADEAAFLALGPGAASWLMEAGAFGAHRVRSKMAEAVSLAKLHGAADVDRALGTAAITGRFADGDLLSLLSHQARGGGELTEPIRASETHSLQPGTSAWANFGGIRPETEEETA
ncbi:IS21 family transposase [Streptomyces sp. NBC_01619]|uniref:IS21 family transposase n=1 Tax=Streptomyces sp. NBC_01619 TaxID=2975901 RepID=UPI00225B64B7|nr:IS21 family transposase [Streptomyces sp. NBC_01619]MCX4515772.1 IS21 family transposase [Streptomyces sp. NBC_01619]